MQAWNEKYPILKSKETISLKPKGVPFLYEFQTSLMGENKSIVLFQIRKVDILVVPNCQIACWIF
jgi:hypothetical protein